jgi:OOP family OmpA-OmpF porin
MSRTRLPEGLGRGIGAALNAFGALLPVALIAAAIVLPAPALAQQQGLGAGAGSSSGMALPSGGWYSGLSAGRSQFGIRDSLLPATGASLSSLSRDESKTGYKLYGGYQFNRNLTLEGGYADFGRFEAQRDMVAPVTGAMTGNISASGFYLGAVGIVPLPNRFSLFGKLGTAYTTSTGFISSSGTVLPLLTPADLSLKRSEWNSKYGLGANYEMSNKMGLRFEYERINSFGDGRLGEGNVGMWSLGLTKRY